MGNIIHLDEAEVKKELGELQGLRVRKHGQGEEGGKR